MEGVEIHPAKLQFLKEIKTNFKRFVFYSFIAMCGMFLGGLMFFYVEKCYFQVKGPIKYSKDCLEMCEHVVKINQSDATPREVKNVIQNITKQCLEKDHCVGTEDASTKTSDCELNFWNVFSWTEFAFSIIFTVGYGYEVPKSTIGKSLTMVYAMIFIPLATASVVFCGRCITATIKYSIIVFESKILKRENVRWFKTKIITCQVFLTLIFVMLQALLYHNFGLQDTSLFDAVYFVFITTTTLGFGDLKLDQKAFFEMTLTERWCFGVSTFMLFYISFSLLASVINSCVTLGTDSSYKKFKITNMVPIREEQNNNEEKEPEVESHVNQSFKEERC